MIFEMQNNECLRCGHEWVDGPGAHAECFSTGCLVCSSLYWRKTEKAIEAPAADDELFNFELDDTAEDMWHEFHHGKD